MSKNASRRTRLDRMGGMVDKSVSKWPEISNKLCLHSKAMRGNLDKKCLKRVIRKQHPARPGWGNGCGNCARMAG
jgi:hypothetical protein